MKILTQTRSQSAKAEYERLLIHSRRKIESIESYCAYLRSKAKGKPSEEAVENAETAELLLSQAKSYMFRIDTGIPLLTRHNEENVNAAIQLSFYRQNVEASSTK
jgi:hypothetical protein